jgi:hypothetical protein
MESGVDRTETEEREDVGWGERVEEGEGRSVAADVEVVALGAVECEGGALEVRGRLGATPRKTIARRTFEECDRRLLQKEHPLAGEVYMMRKTSKKDEVR